MRTMALVVFSLAFPRSVQASSPTNQAAATKTVEQAVLLAGPSIDGLPIVLARVPPAEASRGVEAWTLRAGDGIYERIVVSIARVLPFGAPAIVIDWTINVSRSWHRRSSTKRGTTGTVRKKGRLRRADRLPGPARRLERPDRRRATRARLCQCCPTGHRMAAELNRPSRSRGSRRTARPASRQTTIQPRPCRSNPPFSSVNPEP